ncbi:MAG: hypothetical protein J6M58_02980 [Clostridium sp.]|nr:hypothetical protein [Clostridium sp.]MBP3215169.1 hypothetical protein [Clostridium sp.]
MRLYVDMDGTMTEYRTAATLDDYMTEGFYESLKPTELAAYCNTLARTREDLEVYVLSIYILPPALKEKNDWLDHWCPHIDEAHRIILPNGSDKAMAIAQRTGKRLGRDDVLIDDHTPNLLSWKRSGGRAIKWLNGINGFGKRYTGERIGDIRHLEEVLSAS